MKNDIDSYLTCPLCNSIRFYIEGSDDQLYFLSIKADGTPQFVDPDVGIILQETDTIYCTSCGWHGNYTELIDLEELRKKGTNL